MRTVTTIAVVMLSVLSAVGQAATGGKLYNVALTTLGATAKGSGAGIYFNKDWPALNALRPGTRGGGTIFDPFKGARVDIRLVVPVDIKAVEVIGLDYHGTMQVNGIDIYIDGKKIKHADLPETPGRPVRIPVSGHGQHVSIVATGAYPRRTMPNGKKGPDYGGWLRIRVLSTTNVAAMMKQVDNYQVAPSAANIAPTIGSAAVGKTKVYGHPRHDQGPSVHDLGLPGHRTLQEDAQDQP